MKEPTRLVVIVDPTRATILRIDPAGQELAPQRVTLRSSAAGLRDALAQLSGGKRDLPEVASEFRKKGALKDMREMAESLAGRLRSDGYAVGSARLAVIVAPEMADLVAKAFHPDLAAAVQLFQPMDVTRLSEDRLNERVADWLARMADGRGAAPV